ncbi:MAG TPA: hypothetical protein ENI92_08945 [Bacteroidetes bacterium]|nr:hypothetical protein [Bacteroidota bacterium]
MSTMSRGILVRAACLFVIGLVPAAFPIHAQPPSDLEGTGEAATRREAYRAALHDLARVALRAVMSEAAADSLASLPFPDDLLQGDRHFTTLSEEQLPGGGYRLRLGDTRRGVLGALLGVPEIRSRLLAAVRLPRCLAIVAGEELDSLRSEFSGRFRGELSRRGVPVAGAEVLPPGLSTDSLAYLTAELDSPPDLTSRLPGMEGLIVVEVAGAGGDALELEENDEVVEAVLLARLHDVDEGRLLAAYRLQTEPGADSAAAAEAILPMSGPLAEAFLADIISELVPLHRGSRRILLVVQGLALRQKLLLARRVKSLEGVRKVEMGSLGGEPMQLSVSFTGTEADLAGRLDGLPLRSVLLVVEQVEEGRILLKVRR